MNARISSAAAVAVAVLSCMLLLATPNAYAAKVAQVRVGSPDAFGPGTDGNYSMAAQIDAAGNVSGQWQDAFTLNPGFHINVTCLTVVGNTAWVGGVIDQATNPAFIGVQARAKVVDGGLPNGGGDTISFTVIFPNGGAPDCNAQAPFQQFPLFQGNVSIK